MGASTSVFLLEVRQSNFHPLHEERPVWVLEMSLVVLPVLGQEMLRFIKRKENTAVITGFMKGIGEINNRRKMTSECCIHSNNEKLSIP